MSLSAAEQRIKVVETMLLLEEKNKFSQSTRYRMRVDSGYSDSTSVIQYAYRIALGINIGTYIVSQYTSRIGIDVDIASTTQSFPEEAKLLPGDLLFFRGKQKTNPYDVTHVEMYLGDNKIIGHVKGKGPNIKSMIGFCKSRDAAGKGYLKARRFILYDILDQVDQELILRLQNQLNVVGLKDGNHNKLIEDGIAGIQTLSACPMLRKGKENPIVAVMQEGLIQLGYQIGAMGANGLYDEQTMKAVKHFEKDHHLKCSGIFGEEEWKVWLNLN